MKLGFLTFLLMVLNVSVCSAAESSPFQVRGNQNGNTTTLIASNRGQATVSAKITVWGDNIASDRTFPLIVRIPASTDRVIAHLFPAAPGSSKFNWSSEHMPGDIDALHDPRALYRMPYRDGDMFTLGQSPGGVVVTHTDIGSRNAVDIPMPEGAPIVAARAGIVIQTKSDADKSGWGPDEKSQANFVEIQHEDGTIATYAHLKTNGVFVFPGQQVTAGMEIGLAGSTGFSSGPHLHFVVQELRPGDPEGRGRAFHRASVPFMFYVGNPALPFAPKEGLQVMAEYRQAVLPPTMVSRTPEPQWSAESSQAPTNGTGSVYLAIPAEVSAFFRGMPLWGWVLGGVLIFLVLAIAWPRPRLRSVHFLDRDR